MHTELIVYEGMVKRINEHLVKGTFQIVCSSCGYVICGPEKGNCTTAAQTSMEYENALCPNGCTADKILENNPNIEYNKYNAENPYCAK